MGQFFDKDSFTIDDHKAFRVRLNHQLEDLRDIINQAKFSQGAASFGAELEMYLLDEHALPKANNQRFLDEMNHPLLTEELNKFNLEFNLSPVSAKGKPFSKMQKEIAEFSKILDAKAQTLGTKIATIGILPTLTEKYLDKSYMTDLPRYRALTNELSALRGNAFKVDINGQDHLKMQCDEVTLEGANTSFQVHLKVPADRFSQLYNATQMTTPLVLALAGNSPTFMGYRLWHETRVALFKQSIDSRIQELTEWRQPSRVNFGHGWVRNGAWELFAESVALYKPITPYLFEDECAFKELNLHHGTVWSWNRAVFEAKHPRHLRIEYRTLPAGPTNIDMMANAAFGIGLTQAFSHKIDGLLPKIPFQHAEYNFYRAAKHGLDANVVWPLEHQHGLKEQHITDIIKAALPLASQGLHELDVDASEVDELMAIIENRLASRQTGAVWQLKCLEALQQKYSKPKALEYLMYEYMARSKSGEAVSTWTL